MKVMQGSILGAPILVLLFAVVGFSLSSSNCFGADDILTSAKTFKNINATEVLRQYAENFDELRLHKNEHKEEVKWFIGHGKDAFKWLEKVARSDRNYNLEQRKAALFLLAKGWPYQCDEIMEHQLDSKEVGMHTHILRCQKFLEQVRQVTPAPEEWTRKQEGKPQRAQFPKNW